MDKKREERLEPHCAGCGALLTGARFAARAIYADTARLTEVCSPECGFRVQIGAGGRLDGIVGWRFAA